ncbi:MAG: family N-acetyltransferase, partial [Brevibacillus sp.]|nr:family N-acetyltransferase [Brevibacillus sp.]
MEKNEMAPSLSVRLISSVDELAKVRDLEKIIWGEDDPVPVSHAITAVKNGGMVLGAYVEDQLIGFQYSFAGFNGQKTYLCSHTLGVHPNF